ncbi:MAG: DUF1592 domain-containing protein [Verrucomicrobia bacterium]|nr:DUF1592 domain-containing protein [Verrucomicrobiota bacterium]MDA1066166.1 DUF1592 domain-containing protein [Verrucomicrobiota bacterium]
MVRNLVHNSPGAIKASRYKSALPCGLFLIVTFIVPHTSWSAELKIDTAIPIVKQFCFDCHNDKKTKGDINFETLTRDLDIPGDFKSWELAAEMLEMVEMPPDNEDQPSDTQRQQLASFIRKEIEDTVQKNAGDPGEIVLRRLTSAEYAYTIKDLTGLEFDFEKSFMDEAVGGEGFSNVGEVQFIQDSTLERYLDAAKTVASHALIGAGALDFYTDPGDTGQELSAINRIKTIYRENGFRTGAGEGANEFGLDQYAKAFYAAWYYQHRHSLGRPSITLTELAKEESISPKFTEHIWKVLTQAHPSFPTSEIIDKWNDLPIPIESLTPSEFTVRNACSNLYEDLFEWQKTLAASTIDDEEYAVLSDEAFEANQSHQFRVRMNRHPTAIYTEFEILAKVAGGKDSSKPAVHWKQPTIRILETGSTTPTLVPLRELVSQETAELIQFGIGVNRAKIDDNDFVTDDATKLIIQVQLPKERSRAEFQVEAILDTENGDDVLVRCEITDGYNANETIASTGSASALLADPNSPQIEELRTGILAFAQNLPQVSHLEPTPSDRDHIPEPFDNTYNKPERNYFHTAIKYQRQDSFLTNIILDSASARKLDEAWADLLTSFDYHDTIFRFANEKYDLKSPVKSLADLDQGWINELPSIPHEHVENVFQDFNQKQTELQQAQAGQINDVLLFAEQAWRRPLRKQDKDRLTSFYSELIQVKEQSHQEAIRTLITRILVAPEFLYRIESPIKSHAMVPLSNWELASRLSYFLWSSKPDEELLKLAASGELSDPEILAEQTKRMLRDPKSRRFVTEFFGQWFGFYRFDGYNGIDTELFNYFTDELKAAMYHEAISFFEYVVTQDRPVDEIVYADYTFLNPELAQHYGIPWDSVDSQSDTLVRVDGTRKFNRGGLLNLGAVLTVTSAPLRTSAVKRGDWILRRVLGTPTPPPPADAGSIPNEDVLPDGKTVRERLEAHRRESSCVNCHTRIDPLGFALENFNPIGQWRDTYRDGGNIDTMGILNDGTLISGLDDLYHYFEQEKATVRRNLCRKLLGYALGRSEILADRILIDKMMNSLEADNRFSNLITQIVTSTQFRHQRSQRNESAAIEKKTSSKEEDTEI